MTPSNEKHVLFIFEIMEVFPTIFGVDDISEYPQILLDNLFPHYVCQMINMTFLRLKIANNT